MFKLKKLPQHEKVRDATGAFAGLSLAVAAGANAAMWAFAPTGFAAVAIAFGFKSPPLLIAAIPIVLIICAAVGVLAGLVGFYSWLRTPSP